MGEGTTCDEYVYERAEGAEHVCARVHLESEDHVRLFRPVGWRPLWRVRSYCLFNCARAPDVGAFPRPPAGGIIMSMGFSSDGLLLAAGDNKGTAHVWAKQPSGYAGQPPGMAARRASSATGDTFAVGALSFAVGCLCCLRCRRRLSPVMNCTMQIVGLSDVAQRTRRRCGLVQMG